jgi:hypothetical protein
MSRFLSAMIAVALAVGLVVGQQPPRASAATEFTFNISADAHVDQANPDVNMGSWWDMFVGAKANAELWSYYKVTVSGLTAPVTSARLRVYVANGSVDGPAVYPTSSTWTSGGLTWNTRPLPTGAASFNAGNVPTGAWYEWDVTSLVGGDGTYSFILKDPTPTDGLGLRSRESAEKPQLLVSTGTTTTRRPTTRRRRRLRPGW